VEDTLEGIFRTLGHMALVHRSGGGTGFSFSHLRPRGDAVNGTAGAATGPVSFIRVYDAATAAVRQGGRRRGANMFRRIGLRIGWGIRGSGLASNAGWLSGFGLDLDWIWLGWVDLWCGCVWEGLAGVIWSWISWGWGFQGKKKNASLATGEGVRGSILLLGLFLPSCR
jgi:hypothetical protein